MLLYIYFSCAKIVLGSQPLTRSRNRSLCSTNLFMCPFNVIEIHVSCSFCRQPCSLKCNTVFPPAAVDIAEHENILAEKTMSLLDQVRRAMMGESRNSNCSASLFENYFILFTLTNLCAFYLKSFGKARVKNRDFGAVYEENFY